MLKKILILTIIVFLSFGSLFANATENSNNISTNPWSKKTPKTPKAPKPSAKTLTKTKNISQSSVIYRYQIFYKKALVKTSGWDYDSANEATNAAIAFCEQQNYSECGIVVFSLTTALSKNTKNNNLIKKVKELSIKN